MTECRCSALSCPVCVERALTDNQKKPDYKAKGYHSRSEMRRMEALKVEEQKEKREWWIYKGDSNFCQELQYDFDLGRDVKCQPDGFYDMVSTADTIDGGIHVVEASRLNEVNVKLAEAERYIKVLEAEIAHRHIIGKVYDVTRENINRLAGELDAKDARIAELEAALVTSLKEVETFPGCGEAMNDVGIKLLRDALAAMVMNEHEATLKKLSETP